MTCGTPGADGPGGILAGVVNTYYPGGATAAAGATSITVGGSRGSAMPIASGDLVLVMQMQAASINSTNTNSYGDGVAGDPASGSTALNGSGQYEYVTATGPVAAGALPVAGSGGGGLLNNYTAAAASTTQGQQSFQVIRVPQYSSATLGSTLTASAWNGATGGVLAIDVAGATALGSATVNLDSVGFRGGSGRQQAGDATATGTDYRSLSTLAVHGQKGEGIAGTPAAVWDTVGGALVATGQANDGYPNGSSARGAPGTAGGGGTDPAPASNAQNTGGGGGGNGGTGGLGGNSWSSNLVEGGLGGVAYPASAAQLVLGGGGGAGSRNNSPAIAGASSGGTGGGIALLRSGSVSGTGTITADGGTGPAPDNDGGGGGGAGGSILVAAGTGTIAGLTVHADGGAGANAWATSAPGAGNANAHGPGGGGAGGEILTSSAPVLQTVAGGAAGTTTTAALAYGAQPGTVGAMSTSPLGASPGVKAGDLCLPAFSVTKTTSTPTVVQTPAGTSASFTVAVSNAAAQGTAIGVQITDPLPAGFSYATTGSVVLAGGALRPATVNPVVGATTPVFGTFSIPGGGSVTITFTTNIAATVAPGAYPNIGTATYSDPQRSVAGATLSVSSPPVAVTVIASDMVITKSHIGNFTVGAAGTYTLTASNAGNAGSAGTVTVADTLPAGLTPTAATGTGWTCGVSAQTVTCTRGDTVAPGAGYPPVTITVSVGPGAAPSVSNTASVAGGGEFNTGNDTATDPTTVTPSADLSLRKSHAGNFTVGQNGTYTLTVTNNGPSASGTVTLTDPLPTGAGFISGTGAGWGCSASGQTVTCSNAAGLASGAVSAISLTVSVSSAALPSVTNTATVAGTAFDRDPANNAASDPTTVVSSADVRIVKSHAGNFTVGLNGTFTLAVTNAGPSPSGVVTVTDTLPADLGYVSATGTNWACSPSGQTVTCSDATGLNSGASTSITLVVSVGPAASPSVSNSATVAGSAPDPNSANDTSTDSVTVVTSADVSIVKSHAGNFTAGTNGTYTLAVSNAGPSPTGGLTVTDTLPAGLGFLSGTGGGWTCSASGQVVTCTNPGGLAAGAGAGIALVVSTGQAAVPGVTNTAAVAGTAPDPAPLNNSSSDPTTVTPSADVSIVKTHSGVFLVGLNGTYTLSVSNAGPSPTGALTVNDTLPASLSYVSATGAGWLCSAAAQVVTCGNAAGLGSGTSTSVTLTVLVGAGAATGVSNTATVSEVTADPNPGNNSSTDSTTAPSADVSIVKTHSGSFIVGATGTYTLAVSNAGPSPTGGLTVADTLPAGLSYVSGAGTGWACSASGQLVTCTDAGGLAGGAGTTVTLLVAIGPAAVPSVTNIATITSTTFDPAVANNSSTDTAGVATSADVSIVKSHTGNFTVGVNNTFSLAVANAGPSASGALTVSDTLPVGLGFVSATGTGWTCSVTGQAVTCTAAGLPSGGSSTITLTVSVAQAAAPTTTNTATETTTSPDPNAGNNSSSNAVTVVDSADVSITKTHSGSFTAGVNGTYTLAVANAGPSPSGALTVTDTLPAGLGFVSGTGAGWTCGASAQVVTCTDLAGLAAGGSTAITLVVSVGAAAAPSVTNSAAISAVSPDPNAADNSSSDPTTVNGSADVSIVKTHSGSFTVGINGIYSLTVANSGPSASGTLIVTDALPSGLGFVSETGTGWICTATGQTITCFNAAGLAAGASSILTLTVSVSVGAVPSVVNTGSVTSATGDPNAANNTSSDPTTINPSADASVVKTHSGNFIVGINGSYALAVANAGPSPTGALTVTDILPAGLGFVSGTGTGWACSVAAQTVTCSSGAGLASGTNSTITLVVSVAPSAAPGVTNTATLVAATFDANAGNNSSSDPTTVIPTADSSIVKTHTGSFTVGVNGTYALAVSNAGPSATGALTVSDTLPAGLSFLSGTGAGWVCTASGQTVSCSNGAGLASGAGASIALVVGVGAAAAPSVTNSAAVAEAATDPNLANNSSSDPTTVNGSADVSIAKSHGGAFTVGVNGTYTLALTNAGPSPSGALTVSDALPAGLSFVGGTGTGWTCSASGQTVTCTSAGLTAGGSSSIALTVAVGPAAAPGVTNSVAVVSATPDPNSANDTASDPTTVNPSADVSIVKTHGGAVIAGAPLTYSLAVANAGPSPSGALTVSDTLPAGLTFVSGTGSGWVCGASGQVVTCTAPGLASGGSSSIVVTVSVSPAATGTIANTATVASGINDANPGNNSSTDTAPVGQTADVSIVKSHAGAFTVGQNGTYDLAVSNAGPSPTGALTVSDTLPSGLGYVSGVGTGWTCGASGQVVTCTDAGGIASGASSSVTLTVSVGAVAPPSLTNTATVAETATDPTPGNNSSSDPTTVTPSADVSIVKTHSGAVIAGAPLTYSLDVANAGPSPSGALTVSDTLPAGLTFVSGTGSGWACGASGQVVTCTAPGLASGGSSSIVVTVSVAPAATGTIANTATVASGINDANPGNNSSTDTAPVGQPADVSIVKSHAGSFTVGINGTYTLAVSNAGPSGTGALTVSDTLPVGLSYVSGVGTGWTCGASGQVVTCTDAAGVASGASSSVTLTVGVGATAAPGITNTAAVAETASDPTPGNNTSSDPTTVTPSADVSIVKSHAGPFTVGINGTYALAVSNAGPSPTGALTVSDTLPAGLGYVSGVGTGWTCGASGQVVTCTDAGGLASGASSSVTLTVGVGATAAPGITNTATVAETAGDPTPGNNSSSDPTTVTPSADVSIVKTHSGAVIAGAPLTYSLAVANAGPSPSGALTVSDTLPAGLTFVSGTGSGWVCGASGQVVTCADVAGLAGGGGSSIALTVNVAAGVNGTLANTATASGSVNDGNPGNNSSTDTAAVAQIADVSIIKTHSGSFAVGQNGTYILMVANAGPSPTGALTVSDTLPPGLTYVSATGTDWACTVSGPVVTCTDAIGLASAGNSSIAVVVGVGAAAAPGVTNTAAVAETATDPGPGNNISSDPTAVTPTADVSIVKTHSGSFVVGTTGTYTLAVANAGPSPTGAMTVSDTLPSGMTFVSGGGTGWGCAASGQVVTCSNAAGLAAGSGSSIALIVAVAAPVASMVTNTATVAGTASDPDLANNISSDPTAVTPAADVSIVKSHSGSFTVGQDGSYALAVANAGPSATGALTVNDTLPVGLGYISGAGSGWSCSASGQAVSCTAAAGLAAGGSGSITLVVSVAATAAPGVTNTVTVLENASDPDLANNSSSDPTTVTPSADVSIVKSHAGTFTVGLNGTYTLAVSNAGPSPTGGLTVTDTLPTGLSYVSGVGTGWTCAALGQVVTCTDGAGLASAGSSSLTLVVGVGAVAAPGVTNTATVAGTAADPIPGNNSSSDPTTVTPSADVSIVKSHAGPFTVGISGTYALALSNAGPSGTGALTVSDTLPAGLSYVSGAGTGWTCGASGQAVTCTDAAGLGSGANSSITLTVSVGAVAAPSVTNTATVVETASDPTPGNNSSSDPTTVTPSADVSIVKSHAGTFTVGLNATYGLALANAGPSATGALTVSDTLPAGLSYVSGAGTGWACGATGQVVTCTDPAGLASGGSSNIALTVGVGAAAAPGVTNTATVAETATDPTLGDNSSSDPTTVTPSADVSIVKSHAGTFTVGLNATYGLALANAGPSATGALTVSDTLPAGLSYVSGAGTGWTCGASGQVVTCTDAAGIASGANSSIALTVSVGAVAAPSVTNNATVAETATDPTPGNNSSSDPTTVTPSADVGIVKSHAGPFTVGLNGTYTLAVSNAGPSGTGALTVSDTLPAGLSFVSATGSGWTCAALGQVVTCTDAAGLASGGNAGIAIVVGVGVAAAPGVTNTATVTETATDPVSLNNTSSDPTTVNPSADVSIVKTHSGAVIAGAPLTYSLAVANAGPSPSGALAVSDTLPLSLSYVSGAATGWVCGASGQVVTCGAAGGLASGGSSSIVLTVTLSSSATGTITNTATVAGGINDANPGNNSSTDTAAAGQTADVSIVKTHAGGFTVGTNGTYTLAVANAGPSPTGTLTVSDTLPAGLSLVSGNGTGWSCGASGQVVTCTDAAGLVSGGNTSITLVVTVAARAAPGVINTATVAETASDPDAANNTSSDPTTVTPSADVSITKTHSGNFTAGLNGAYALTASNAGPSPTGALTVSDTLPAGLSYVSGIGTGWTCGASGQVVTCTDAAGLAMGANAGITLTVSVGAVAAPAVTNTATVAESASDPDLANNRSSDTATVGAVDLMLVKEPVGTFTRGGTGTYVLTVTNVGTTATFAPITITDSLPVGLSFVSGTGSAWACSAIGQTVTCVTSAVIGPASGDSVALVVGIAKTASTSIRNTAWVATSGDIDAVNNSGSASVTISAGSLDPTLPVVTLDPTAAIGTPSTGADLRGNFLLAMPLVLAGFLLLFLRRRRDPGDPAGP